VTLIKTSTTQQHFSRRTFLRAIGASGAVLPLLHAEQALAATPNGFPKRLVTVAWTNGVAQSAFFPATDADPTASEVLKPLAALKAKVLLAAGLDYQIMTSAHKYDGHFGYPIIYTGTYKNTGGQNNTSDGPSLDQVVSTELAKSVTLPMPLLNITLNGASTSFRGPGQRNTGEKDPGRLFKALFSSTTTTPAQVDSSKERSKSVLDFVQGELKVFSTRMGTEDRAKIQAHLEAVRDIELRLTAMGNQSCTGPTMGGTSSYPDQVKAMYDIAAMALRCDLTRVVSVVLGADGGSSPGSFPFLGVNADYHGIAHLGSSGYAQKIKIDTWYYQQLANFATLLDGAMEGTGTALDNTVVVAGNDMAEGSTHSTYGMQFVLVGSCGGYLKTGRVARLGSWATKSGQYYKGDSGVAHNKLLATLGNAMGVAMPGFGSIAGTLSELVA